MAVTPTPENVHPQIIFVLPGQEVIRIYDLQKSLLSRGLW